MKVLIPAGGSGTRLWPLSRSNHPKQVLNLTGGGTMIQETVERIRPLVAASDIYVITEQSHAAELQAQVPGMPQRNCIIEPTRRDTAPVIGLGTLYVLHEHPDAVIASLHADHIIAKPKEFLKVLRAAEQLALREDVIVTIGIHPTYPSTGYGYIASGEEISDSGKVRAFRVRGFTEKPNLPTAQAFLATGDYFWNAGMFIARGSVLMDAYRKHAPKLYAGLSEIAAHFGKPSERKVLNERYAELPKEPVDTAIMEKANNIVVIPADIGWSDIGSWDMLKSVLQDNKDDNLTLGDQINIDTTGSLIYSQGKRLVATIGLEDMIVVDSEDAVLICPISQADRVKELVKRLQKHKQQNKYT